MPFRFVHIPIRTLLFHPGESIICARACPIIHGEKFSTVYGDFFFFPWCMVLVDGAFPSHAHDGPDAFGIIPAEEW